ncbi:MAG: sulfotransferase [Acidobacteriota bacterium]|nr:MAG: sulfotransferase [Acidobacteriota bacterium]
MFSPLQGARLRGWLRVLRDNHFRVHPAYWGRAALTTISNAINTALARREQRKFGARLRGIRAERPLFVLGHYRSGTTHLHLLLCCDPDVGYPNYYQTCFPSTFLTTEPSSSSLLRHVTPRKRPQDDVDVRLDLPSEDELALCADTFLSPHMSWHFPARAEEYDDYLTFESASKTECRRWKRSLDAFSRKLTLKYGRRLVFKSPCHTARVKMLLELFPDARFVHIHRHPYDVFRSTRHMERKVRPLLQYQMPASDGLDERILRRYETMYEAFFRSRELIPPGRLTEVSYADLMADPLATARGIYEALGLSGFASARPAMERYLDSVAGFRKSELPPLDRGAKKKVSQCWARSFETWGYTG